MNIIEYYLIVQALCSLLLNAIPFSPSTSAQQTINQEIDPLKEFRLTWRYLTEEEAMSLGGEKLVNLDKGHHKWILSLHNMPQDSLLYRFRLIRDNWNDGNFTTSEYHKTYTLALDEKGENHGKPYGSMGFLPGERAEIVVNSSEGHVSQSITVVPNPILDVSTIDGASIRAELFGINPTGYLIYFKDFAPNELVMVECHSKDELITSPLHITDHTYFTISPGVLGSQGGVATLEITRNNLEKLSINLPWGDNLSYYARGCILPDKKTISRAAEYYR